MNKTPYFNEIIEDIKDKKELRTLDEDFVAQKLNVFFEDKSYERQKAQLLKKLESAKNYKQFSKSKEHDFLIKEMRHELRKVYGVFILEGYEKRNKILSKINTEMYLSDKEQFSEITKELMLLHKSTKERLPHYEELYEKIFYTIQVFEEQRLAKTISSEEFSKQKFKILDLACGLNPLGTIFIKNPIEKYYASDISTEDCEFLKSYFDKTSIDAIMFPLDLLDETKYDSLKKIKVDLCFIFKTLDGLERINRNITKKLLETISTKYYAITFPTLSISGHREIKENRRLWLERMLESMGWTFQKFLLDNELLYVVRKG